MAPFLGSVLLWFSFRLIFAAKTSTCKYNEYTVESESGNLTCLKCHSCPAGSGLVPQCDTIIKASETKNECKPCVLGKTYSAHHDISSCEPCNTCSNHQTVVKTCTLYSDSQCKDTCSKGFYFEDSTGDCQPCTWCCPDGSIKVESGCKEMPLYKQCDVNTARRCKPKCKNDQYVVPGSKGGGHCKDCEVCPPGTVRFPECGSVVENINNISCREGERPHFKAWHAGILAGGIAVVIILALFLWYKFCRRGSPGFNFRRFVSPEENGDIEATAEVHESSQPENLVTSGNSGDPASIQTCERTPIPEDPSVNNNCSATHEQTQAVTGQGSKLLESLVNDFSDFVENIFRRLDTRIKGAGHYEVIANYYGFDIFEIRSRFETSVGGPSRAMIEAIAVRDTELTIEKFARVVEEKARRKDVADLLRAYDRDSLKESV
ncbi:uncharacterized protein LOC141879991 isoform X2 [Acropora palmata]|uniref:uncharacterized protein LOC141879991 isoform X2 n=1 Tax=Acropora palmata TaxID=6131 RepID=UPI003DA14286